MIGDQEQRLTDLFVQELHAARRVVRVSVAALLRVRLADGRLVLLDTGGPVLGPPGGALAYYWEAGGLLAELGWCPERQPDTQGRIDLRGRLPGRSLPAFLAWLETGQHRETAEQGMRREIGEELAEAGHAELVDDVPGAGLTGLGTRVEGPAPVAGDGYDLQLRRFDVFELAPGCLHDRLSDLATDPWVSTVVSVSLLDIARGRHDDARIGSQAAYLTDRNLLPAALVDPNWRPTR